MVGTAEEQKAGMTWFVSALIAAVALTTFLMCADSILTHSKSEETLGKELYRLRLAQTTLGTGVVDPRSDDPTTQVRERAVASESSHEGGQH